MAVLTVGAQQTYATLSAAIAASSDGDVIQVKAGTYTNDFATINTRITIQAVGGVVNLVATIPPPNGKAILVTNTDVTLDGLAFSGVEVADGNGAGIRYQAGNLTVNHCYFYNNQDGLLAAANPTGSIAINNSEFAFNGTGDGATHNLYVGAIAKLTVTNSYFHNAIAGHEIKSRALTTVIQNNRIADGPTGTASYAVDLPNGGNATVSGNMIEKGPNAQNPAFIHFGGEGTPYASSSLTISNNTFLNDRPGPSAAALLNQTSIPATLSGNQAWGLTSQQMAVGPASVSGTTILQTEPALSTDPPSAVSPDTVSVVLTSVRSGVAFTASVDGHAIGPMQRLAAAGTAQTFSFSGAFGAGAHVLAIDFLGGPRATGTTATLAVSAVVFDGTSCLAQTQYITPHQTQTFLLTSGA